MERFQVRARDVFWLIALTAMVWYLTQDLQQVLLVVMVYVVVFVVVNRVRAYAQHVLGQQSDADNKPRESQ